MNFQEMERTIYLDGRPHPSAHAPHTSSGSTGYWVEQAFSVSSVYVATWWRARDGRVLNNGTRVHVR